VCGGTEKEERTKERKTERTWEKPERKKAIRAGKDNGKGQGEKASPVPTRNKVCGPPSGKGGERKAKDWKREERRGKERR
jgi:hypothetical protein